MAFSSWLRSIRRRFPSSATPRSSKKSRQALKRARLQLETLEDRFVPSTISVTSTSEVPNYASNVTIAQLNPIDTAVTFRDAVNAADNTGGNNTIVLQTGDTYSFNSAPATPSGNITTTQPYWWYGPNALPVIDSTITIQGNGAILDVTGGNALRFFYVSNGISNTNTPAGNLTLENLTLENGLAKGGIRWPASSMWWWHRRPATAR